uniref:Uncharacterized protein n=1 Tax=Anguilla anguilla TaxID=7936 RepID=A0A0E9PXX1_ANGAN
MINAPVLSTLKCLRHSKYRWYWSSFLSKIRM